MRNLILIVCSPFVIGAFAGPYDSTEYIDSPKIFTWPAVEGIIYQLVLENHFFQLPEWYIRMSNKTMDNNPDGDTVFMKTDSIKVTSNGAVSPTEYAQLFHSRGIRLMVRDGLYSFNQGVLNMTIPKLGQTTTMKVLSDASIKTEITVDYNDEKDFIQSSSILSIMVSALSKKENYV